MFEGSKPSTLQVVNSGIPAASDPRQPPWREIYDKIPNSRVPCHLTEANEAIGILINIHERAGVAVACFDWGAIWLPLELATELRELRGEKIAILHLDGWHVRLIDTGAHD